MATPSEKLAQSLEVLHKLQSNDGVIAIQTKELTRTHRERLVSNGFLIEVIKGWYIPCRPDDIQGDSTSWYTSFWHFCAAYLNSRFGKNWILSPEQSIAIHSGNWTVPRQLLVRSPKANNNIIYLPFDTSLFDIRVKLPVDSDIEQVDGIRVYTLASALVLSSPTIFSQSPMDARAALSMIRDGSEILNRLLDGGHSTVAGRLVGAFRNIGRERIADDILKTMLKAGYDVRENDPFTTKLPSVLNSREVSPYANRIKLMWQHMRGTVIENFPGAPGLPVDSNAYMKRVEDVFVTDAYHSLSIEGYRVTPELIERVRKGEWNPEENASDNEQKNALAARGYWQAFQAVKESIAQVLNGENAGIIAYDDHGTWYRELFGPSVTTGILNASDLAGYRNHPVYIRRSKHVPLNKDAVKDTMPVLFDLLRDEPEPAVRVVLGHFIFVYIHPYNDGNGRIGRFLMNVMLASGGYPWTVIPLEERSDYMQALEKASVDQDITDFARFIGKQVEKRLQGNELPKIPN